MIVPDFSNKSVRKILSKEYLIEKRYPEFYKYLISTYPEDITFPEKVYWYMNNISTYILCPVCGNRVNFENIYKGYYKYCSNLCSNRSKEVFKKRKQTKLERYGDENFVNTSKTKQTKLERYGDENYTNQEKRRQTNIERYGVDCNFKLKGYRERAKQTKLERYGDENYTNQEKRRQTNIERYGVDCNFKLKGYRERAEQTKLERYGDENYINQEKRRQTNIERYGVDCNFKSEEFRNKTKESNLKKHGVEFPMQRAEVKDKLRVTRSKKIIEKHTDIIDCHINSECSIYTVRCDKNCAECTDKKFTIPSNHYWIRKNNNIELCTKILPIGQSKYLETSIELFVRSLLDKYNINYQINVRNIIPPLEIDIYIPSKNIAIECNGVYWHCDKNKDPKYHYNKFIKCQEKDIQLISIWEDQISNNPTRVKSIILSKLGIYEKRLYARSCSIKEVPSKECNSFIDKYHLQGKTNSSIRLGLYYNDELVSIMTFGKGRKCLNSRMCYELYRYCCKEEVQVIGGASKLFKHFLKEYNPESIESFSSNDISNGNLYKQLGFEKVSDSIGYWYIDKEMNRYHRYNFRKQKLIQEGFDENKTEFEIMNERGFYRIYDSGQTKWIFSNEN